MKVAGGGDEVEEEDGDGRDKMNFRSCTHEFTPHSFGIFWLRTKLERNIIIKLAALLQATASESAIQSSHHFPIKHDKVNSDTSQLRKDRNP